MCDNNTTGNDAAAAAGRPAAAESRNVEKSKNSKTREVTIQIYIKNKIHLILELA
jgi:hypothetical protein